MSGAVLLECGGAGALLLDFSDGSLAFLNATAAQIWKLHLGGLSIEEIAARLESSSLPPAGHSFSALVEHCLKTPKDVVSSAVGGPYSFDETSENTLTVSFEGQPRFQVEAQQGLITQFEPTPLRRTDVEAVAPKIFAMRGYDIMHGAVVEILGAGWIITGNSGAGKSTLAHMLAKAGHRGVSDDKIVLRFPDAGQGRPSIVPSGESAIMDWVARVAERVVDSAEAVPIAVPEADESHLPLRGVLSLSVEGRIHTAAAEMRKLELASAVKRLLPQVYFASMRRLTVEAKLQRLLQLCRTVPVFDVHLPNSLGSLERCVGNLVDQISKVSS